MKVWPAHEDHQPKGHGDMLNRSRIEEIVYQAIDRVNEVLLDENGVPKAPATVLLGPAAVLDSMGYVNFIVALEETLVEGTGLTLNLVEQLSAPGNDAPKVATVGEFVDFVFRLVRARR